MITELGKRYQEMARIEDFASFKSELLGALGGPQTPRPNLSVFATFKKESSYGHELIVVFTL